ncbi:MAG: hypothetical protein JXB50_13650 [Spirochaetes bacterium]|nr:hypothetical protein [Spirochaetota bacterium]
MKKFLIVLVFFNLNFIYSQSLRLLWWNIENFFDTKDDPKKDDTILTIYQYENKLNDISEKLRKINADIAGIAEIENIEILKELAYESGYPFYYLIEGNDPRGIDIALISKWEIDYKTHKDQPTPYKENFYYKFSRDCPEGSFYFNGEKIFLLLNHLKANYKEDSISNKKRTAQIKGILDIISVIYKNNNNKPNIIVMGDLNSLRYTDQLNILEKSGLIILNYLYPEEKIYTIKINNKKRDIDYFIMNKPLFDKIKIKKLQSYNKDDFNKISDHYPICLEFDFKKK